MPFSTYTNTALLNHFFNVVPLTAPSIYVGLSSTLPTVAGGNVTEPSGSGYARVLTGAVWVAAVGIPAMTQNSGTIEFPAATADWLSAATIGYLVFYDAASAGNLLGWANLSNGQPIYNTDQPIFTADTISIVLS